MKLNEEDKIFLWIIIVTVVMFIITVSPLTRLITQFCAGALFISTLLAWWLRKFPAFIFERCGGITDYLIQITEYIGMVFMSSCMVWFYLFVFSVEILYDFFFFFTFLCHFTLLSFYTAVTSECERMDSEMSIAYRAVMNYVLAMILIFYAVRLFKDFDILLVLIIIPVVAIAVFIYAIKLTKQYVKLLQLGSKFYYFVVFHVALISIFCFVKIISPKVR